MQKLPLATQTLYAELMEQLLALEARRSAGSAPGCFTEKTVKGETYYYYQYPDLGGITRQIYLGRKTPELSRAMKRFSDTREQTGDDVSQIQRICAQLRAGNALTTDASSARVIKAFADAGVFQLGGVLVGTHAFAVLGNMLGVHWSGAGLKTHDVDLAGETRLSLTLPNLTADIPGALEQLNMGFLPIPQLDPRQASTSFKVRGSALRVDILTPAAHARKTQPVFLSRFNTAAQPLRFMDYLIEHPERGAIVNGGGILVNVPAPARYAFHKLLILQERDVTAHTKTDKDLLQAAQILALLAEERPGDIHIAWDDLKLRGKGWVQRVNAGLVRMEKHYSNEYRKIRGVVG